jgi:phage baseplate assembly protein W
VVQVDYPLHLDRRGATAGVDLDGHIRDLVEQLLFTAPGERVNRPTFGTGLLQLLFLPNSEPLAAATQATVNGALAQWLGDLITVRDVDVTAEESVLRVTVQYVVNRTGQQNTAQLVRSVS